MSRLGWAVLASLCWAGAPPAPAAEAPPACRTVTLPETRADEMRIYRWNAMFAFGVASGQRWDDPNDYGARLLLLGNSGAAWVTRYHSAGSADSYGIRPTFVANCGGHELLIFGEIGTEYSWGVRVFAYDNGEVEDLGEIPLAVEGEIDAESVIPFMRFSSNGTVVELSFTRDLIEDPGGLNERPLARTAIRYRIDENGLVALRP